MNGSLFGNVKIAVFRGFHPPKGSPGMVT